MKKLYIATILGVAALFSSCSMNEEPFGSILQGDALQTVNDCRQYVYGIYGQLRASTAGAYIAYPELAMDMFQATQINGNRGGMFANGTIQAGNSDITGMYGNMYLRSASANYFIDEAAKFLDDEEISDDQKLEVRKMIGEAKFARAYYYWFIFDRFCESYTEANGDTPAKGIQIALHYYPTSDRGSYPGRSTLNETIEVINADLVDAYSALKAYEDAGNMSQCVPNAYYLNSYTVRALQARMALLTGKYEDAITYAEEVINSGIYSLCTINAYASMWTNDTSTELLFVPFGDKSEGAVATGAYWLASSNEISSDFIPAPDALAMYSSRDVRARAFFSEYDLKGPGWNVSAPVFVKFPGNPACYEETNTLVNKPKPFRLSELYLIVAEAADKLGDATTANKYLNDLRAKRISLYVNETLAGNALTQAIRTERTKELIGEGFRMSDLRRWGEGFTRQYNYGEYESDYAPVENILYVFSRSLTYQAGDYRFVWPIPTDEMTVNPQLNGQQNPGY